MIAGQPAERGDDSAGFTMSSAGLECSCRPVLCGGCKCDVTIPHRLLNCCFPCLMMLTKLTVRPFSPMPRERCLEISNRSTWCVQVLAREQALHRTDTMSERKSKRLAAATILLFVAMELFDCGSDVVVYIHTVHPQSQVIDEKISPSFVPAYLIMLSLSLLVSSIVLLARVGFVYCIAHKRGERRGALEKDEEYLLTTLNELCGVFVLLFEDLPFIVFNCVLIYYGHEILGCSDSPPGLAAGSAAWEGEPEPEPELAVVSCDRETADMRLRQLMISFSISAVSFGFKLSSLRYLWAQMWIKELTQDVEERGNRCEQLIQVVDQHFDTDLSQTWTGDPGERQQIWELGLARLGEQLAAARAAGGAAGKSQLLPRVQAAEPRRP